MTYGQKILFSFIFLGFLFLHSEAIRAKSKLLLGHERNSWRNTENIKTKNDFGGWLLITPDLDWKKKLNTPPDTVLNFNEAGSVKVGQQLVILIFYVNPKTNESNNVSVLCDIRVTRPDRSISVDKRGASCMSGELKGHPEYIRNSEIVMHFSGEESDPIGVWTVEVKLTDEFRDTTLNLRKSFVLEK